MRMRGNVVDFSLPAPFYEIRDLMTDIAILRYF